jgi:hypothetical protein
MPIKCFFIDNDIGKYEPDESLELFEPNELKKFEKVIRDLRIFSESKPCFDAYSFKNIICENNQIKK